MLYTVKLSQVEGIFKVTPNTPGAGITVTIGLGVTGNTGFTVGSGGTAGLALWGTGNSELISSPTAAIRGVQWSSQSGTTNGVRITRGGVDVIQLYTSGILEPYSLIEQGDKDFVITIDGSGTLILDIAKRTGYTWTNDLATQQNIWR